MSQEEPDELKVEFTRFGYKVISGPSIGPQVTEAISGVWLALTDDGYEGKADKLLRSPLTAQFSRRGGLSSIGPRLPNKVHRALEEVQSAFMVETPYPVVKRAKHVIVAERRELMQQWKVRHPGESMKSAVRSNWRSLKYWLGGGYKEGSLIDREFHTALLR